MLVECRPRRRDDARPLVVPGLHRLAELRCAEIGGERGVERRWNGYNVGCIRYVRAVEERLSWPDRLEHRSTVRRSDVRQRLDDLRPNLLVLRLGDGPLGLAALEVDPETEFALRAHVDRGVREIDLFAGRPDHLVRNPPPDRLFEPDPIEGVRDSLGRNSGAGGDVHRSFEDSLLVFTRVLALEVVLPGTRPVGHSSPPFCAVR